MENCDEELIWNEELWDGRIMGRRRIMGWKNYGMEELWDEEFIVEWKNCAMKNWLWGLWDGGLRWRIVGWRIVGWRIVR